jgi:predicted metal-dependent hydrolase
MKIGKVIHSKRKSFSLIVDKEGELLVRAPNGATRRQVQEIVEAHRDWILKKQAEIIKKNQDLRPPRFTEGEAFWFLGQLYPLTVVEDAPHALHLNGHFILAQRYASQAQAVFEAWYKAQARRVLKERVDHWAKQYGLRYASIRITAARTRWGSCSSKDSLNFSWRLIMAPLEVVDYVVVHELAHLKQRNHSKAFWAEVARMLPTYQQHRQWLKKNGYRLQLERVEAAV